MRRTYKISEDIEKKVLQNYVEKQMSLTKSGEEFGLKQFHTEMILKKYGINKRTYVESKQLGRKYPCNDNYFKSQNSNMAYILGLLASDGDVSSKENRVSIQLLSSDSDILEKIRKETESSRPITTYIKKETGKEISCFTVWSHEWKKDLSHYGIVPQKTFKLLPPDFLDPKYRIDYIRGFFDGDSTIYHLDKLNRTFLQIDCASKQVSDWIRSELANRYHVYINVPCTETLSNGTIMYKIKIGSINELKKMYHLFYDDAELYLQRKKEKFEQWLNIPRDSNSSIEE